MIACSSYAILYSFAIALFIINQCESVKELCGNDLNGNDCFAFKFSFMDIVQSSRVKVVPYSTYC